MKLKWHHRLEITTQVRVDWYEAMAASIEAGKPIYETLQAMRRDLPKSGRQPILPLVIELTRRLRGGTRAGAPTRRDVGTELHDLVPQVELLLIQAGFGANRAAEGFRNAAAYLKDILELKASIARGLSMPSAYLAFAVGVLIFFARKVFPAFENSRPRATWPAEAQALAVLGDHAVHLTLGVVGTLLFLVVLFVWVAPRWCGPAREWIDRHVFPFTLVAAINGAQFLTAMRCYMSVGTPFAVAIQDIGDASLPYMRWQCRKVMALLKRGKNIDETLQTLAIVPDKYHWLISVYGGAEDPATSYGRIADQVMRRVKQFVEAVFEKTLSSVMLGLLGLFIVWAYSSMMAIADPSSVR